MHVSERWSMTRYARVSRAGPLLPSPTDSHPTPAPPQSLPTAACEASYTAALAYCPAPPQSLPTAAEGRCDALG
jgi:hypothetical protein